MSEENSIALQALENDTGDREDGYAAYREYYDGKHDTQLTTRQRQYLSIKTGEEFRSNYTPVVVDALVERLKVTGFVAGDQSEVLWAWWKKNRMDHQQGIVHLSAARDGDAYLLVGWDDKKGIPKFTFEPAFDGTEGVKCHYSKDNRDEVRFASKRWESDDGRNRLNVYYPDRVEKYVEAPAGEPHQEQGVSGWVRYIDDQNGGWPLEWVDDEGNPLGIPVIHFKNKDTGYNYGASELRDVVPLQNALNKAIIDLLAAADTTAFRIYWMLGDDPSGLEVAPGVWVHSDHPPTGDEAVQVGYFPGEDLSKLIEFKDAFVVEIARISRIPVSYFQVSSYRAAEGTLKQEESGLVQKAEDRQVSWGNAWEDAMVMGRKLWNRFGETERGEVRELDEDQPLDALWQDAEIRNELVVMQQLQIKREALGVPEEQLWAEAGYTPEQIRNMKETDEYKARQEARDMAALLGAPRMDEGEKEEPSEDEG